MLQNLFVQLIILLEALLVLRLLSLLSFGSFVRLPAQKFVRPPYYFQKLNKTRKWNAGQFLMT